MADFQCEGFKRPTAKANEIKRLQIPTNRSLEGKADNLALVIGGKDLHGGYYPSDKSPHEVADNISQFSNLKLCKYLEYLPLCDLIDEINEKKLCAKRIMGRLGGSKSTPMYIFKH